MTSEAIPQNDLRAFIAACAARGELAHVKDAHWDRELGAVAEVLYRQKVEKSPMLLFDEIPDYPANYRCLYGMFGSPFRLALALGMEPTLTDDRKEMLDHFRKNIKKGLQAHRAQDRDRRAGARERRPRQRRRHAEIPRADPSRA